MSNESENEEAIEERSQLLVFSREAIFLISVQVKSVEVVSRQQRLN